MRRTRFILYALFSVCLAAATPAKASQAIPITRALPSGARLLLQESIPGYAGQVAVVYQSGKPYLGVADGGRLTWQRALPGTPDRLLAPGPRGLFEARVKATSPEPAYFLAFVLQGVEVVSAISGHKAGTLTADEGFIVRSDVVTSRKRDLTHQGEVHYRIISRFDWNGHTYARTSRIRVPDYPTHALPTPSVVIQADTGDRIMAVVEVADTEQKRETGLMYRKSLDPDAGMIFVWQQPVLDSFWMKNTDIPLSLAFIGANGSIQEIQDMAPQTETLHTPIQPYLYALEVNQGFFSRNGIVPGDRVTLHLTPVRQPDVLA